MESLDELLEKLTDSKQSVPERRENIFVSILRRLWHGWLGALLLFLLCLLMAWLIHFPLQKMRTATTKMDVMLIKEREGNRDNNVSYEIVGEMSGWMTTTNKYDEMAIMLSRPVLERMVRRSHTMDSTFIKRAKQVGHHLSARDSAELVESLSRSYGNRIKVAYSEPSNGQKTSIVTLSLTGSSAANFTTLQGLVDAYNAYTREYNNQCYNRTIAFLTHCMDSLKNEINKLDDFDKTFSEGNFVIDIPRQTSTYLEIDRFDESDVRNMILQRELLKIIRNYMEQMGKEYVVVPANTGIEDTQINRIVIQFNDLVMKRSNYLTSMGADAMRVKTMSNQIEDQRQAIIISIDALTQSFDKRLQQYQKNKRESDERLAAMPHKRVVKDQIDRDREIIVPLYKLLQEKRLNAIIARSAEQDLARVVTPPYIVEESRFANPAHIYLLGILLGILLALLYLWNIIIPVKHVSLEDVLKDCILPVWAVLPDFDKRELYEPALESLLTRIRQSGARRLIVTSGYPEEGKTSLCDELNRLLADRGYVDGLTITDVGDYHSNPELPLLSSKAEATIYCIRAEHSKMRSLDFINYAVKEGILKNGAVVVVQAQTNEDQLINFGAFDYEVPRGFKAIKSHASK